MRFIPWDNFPHPIIFDGILTAEGGYQRDVVTPFTLDALPCIRFINVQQHKEKSF